MNSLANVMWFQPSLRTRRSGIALISSLFFVLLISGCTDGGGSAGDAPDDTSDQDSESSQDAILGTEEFGLSEEELVTQIERVEVLIAQCMSEAGFEYIANDFNTVRQGMVADKSLPGLSEEEFIEQHGFGIATLYTGSAPQLAADTTPARIGIGDQNVRIFESLPPADQVAYNRTLLGDHLDATFAVAIELEDFSRTGGCTRTAIEQVFTTDELRPTYVNPLDALIEQDPRMVTALADFAECVRDEGFDYSHPEDVEDDIRSQLDEITGGAPIESLSTEAQAALAELQELERSVAIVAFECEEEILEPIEDVVEEEILEGE